MRLPRPDRAGFTLVELMVAVAIFGVVMAAVLGIQTMFLRGQTMSVGRAALDNNATQLEATLKRAVRTATYIAFPPADNFGSNTLILVHNTDPMNPGNPLIAGQAVTWDFFCQGVTDGPMWRYRGTVPAQPIPTPAGIACGVTAGGELLAGGMGLVTDPLVPFFNRQAATPPVGASPFNNHILLTYSVRMPGTMTRQEMFSNRRLRLVTRAPNYQW